LNIIERLKTFLNLPAAETPREGKLIYVYLPEVLEPERREAQYGQALDAELRLSGLGRVSGGGTMMSAETADGSSEVLYVGVDVDAYDVTRARALLRLHLPPLGCPPGTRLQYEDFGRALQDEYDGSLWMLAQPQIHADQD
jgi:hypothetical protein